MDEIRRKRIGFPEHGKKAILRNASKTEHPSTTTMYIVYINVYFFVFIWKNENNEEK